MQYKQDEHKPNFEFATDIPYLAQVGCKVSLVNITEETDHVVVRPGGHFKNAYGLLNPRTLKFSYLNKIHIFQCLGKIFCVEFQRVPLKFHSKYLTHTLRDTIYIHC